jgi:hypothetical protein
MAVKTLSENPTIIDTIKIDFQTTDAAGNLIDPYRVDQVVIYFIERNFTTGSYKTYTEQIGDAPELTLYYTDTIPVKTYGDDSQNPAWLSSDPSNAYIEKVYFDDEGNSLIGTFRIQWTPSQAREGDYMICWKWTPLAASPKQSAHIAFYVYGDTQATTAMPSHVAPDDKYQKLLDLYTPEMFKLRISESDVTPDVISRMNAAVGKGFTTLENLSNQILDLIDANATHESLLPYLANLFKHKLWSNDPTLWRRQIKRAVPLNKKRGTLDGLVEALGSAGITLQKLTKYWQIVSSSTWTESFVVGDGQTTFRLAKQALLPVNSDNFTISLRGIDTDEYVSLGLNYVSLSNAGSTTNLVWLGDGLSSGAIHLVEGDIVLVTYQIGDVTSQANENYIRALPLMDSRDETTFTYPFKNWNVHLIAEDDPMFDVLIPIRHPFALPVVYGQVRTEFAFSENIYDMEEYNGSLRNSNLPCDIDRTFIDTCSACQSSSISLDMELEDISDDRIREATEIAKGQVPFHAQIRSISYSGAVNEYMPPPVEDIEILVDLAIDDNLIVGQGDFNRLIPLLGSTTGQFLRNELATAITMASGTATGFNSEVVLYSPTVRFDHLNIFATNLLEILTGTNVGTYQVSSPGTNVVKIDQASPDNIPFPLDTSAFTFRLSNPLWTDSGASIFQDDLFVLSDENINFTIKPVLTEANSSTPWKIKILSGIYTGTYNIYDILPNNTLVLSGWAGIVNVTDLNYNLVKNDDTTIVFSSSTGVMTVTRRGRVVTEELDSWGVIQGDYIKYSGSQYQILGFNAADKSEPYILGYTGGNAAGITITVYRRLLDDAIGYVDIRGMYILTTPDYETALTIQNGSNPPVTPIETSSFKENYLVQIGSMYYRIIAWDAQRIDLSGPKTTWGLVGTSLSFSLINYLLTSPVLKDDVEFKEGVDRRGIEPISTENVIAGMPLDLCVSALNNDGILEAVGTIELVSFKIERRDGSIVEQGEIQ